MANTVDDAIHDLANEEARARRKGYGHVTVGIDELAALLEWAVEARGEEEYEYAVQTTTLRDGKSVPVSGFDWTTKDDAEGKVNRMNDTYSRNGYDKYYLVELVKRLKAGKVEAV